MPASYSEVASISTENNLGDIASCTETIEKVTCGAFFEHLELLIKTANNINILLSVIYRPPNRSLTNFINNFSQYLDQIESLSNNKKLHYIFAGDYKINLLQYEKKYYQ